MGSCFFHRVKLGTGSRESQARKGDVEAEAFSTLLGNQEGRERTSVLLGNEWGAAKCSSEGKCTAGSEEDSQNAPAQSNLETVVD